MPALWRQHYGPNPYSDHPDPTDDSSPPLPAGPTVPGQPNLSGQYLREPDRPTDGYAMPDGMPQPADSGFLTAA